MFALLTIVIGWPLVRGAWDTIANYGDPLLNAWILAWDAHGLISQPLRLFDANIFHPYPATLAYSEHLLGIAIPLAGVQWATGNAIFVHNLAVLASFLLAAEGAYLLAYYLTGSGAAGLVAGLAFGFAGYRITEISQLQNLTVQWLPFTFLYLTRLCRTRAQHDAVLFVLFFILQAWSNVYYFFYTALAVGLYLAFRAWLGLRARGLRPDWALVRRLAVSLVVAAMLMTAVFLPYLTARAAVGERPTSQQDGAALQEYLMLPARSLLGRLIPGMALAPSQGKTYFPGFIVVVLAAAAVIAGRPSSTGSQSSVRVDGKERFFYLILAVTALVLSLGPVLRVQWDGGPIFGPMPYAALLRWVPGFTAMRVPARMAMLTLFACAVLAGYGAAYLVEWLRPRVAAGARRAVVVVVVALEVLSCLALPAAGQPVAVGAQTPPVYRWLKQATPQDAVVLELPAMSSYWAWNDPLAIPRLAHQEYFTTYHWRPTILGYSGFYPPLYQDTISFLLSFPSSETLSYLQGLDVRYVVLHADQFEPQQWDAIAKRLPIFAGQLQLVQQFGQDYIYALAAPAPGQQPTQLGIYLPESAAAQQDYLAYIIVHNPRTARLALPVAETYKLTFQWGEAAADTVNGALPLTFPAGVSTIPVSLARPPAGGGPLYVKLVSNNHTVEQRVIVQTGDAAEVQSPPGGERYHYLLAGLNFGRQLTLHGVALDALQYHSGDSLTLTFAWSRTTVEPVGEYVIYCGVQNAQQQRVAGGDLPLPDVAVWQPGQTQMVLRLQQLPFDLPPGQYQVSVGVYDVTGKRFLPIVEADGAERLDSFRTQIIIQ